MKLLKNSWFKILAIILLLIALTNNPYGYYQFLRWAILLIGAYCAYLAYKLGSKSWPWVFGVIAILFNPIIPFTFDKDIWQIIDIIIAVIFFTSLFVRDERKN